MKNRSIEDKSELHILITKTIQGKKDAFTISEIVDDVLENESFGQFCSKDVLTKKVEEIVKDCLNLKVIKIFSTHFFVLS